MTRYCRILIAAIVILGSADRWTVAQAPTGQSRSLSTTATYTFLVGSGFLCDPGDTSMCPATVRGNSGASYEMSGAGTFDVQSKSVKAAGTYNQRSPNGNVLETGVWIASELVTFDSYGTAAGALLPQGQGITRLRGRWFDLAVPGLDQPVPTLPMFHPSFLLRTPERKRETWRDLLSLRSRLDELLMADNDGGFEPE